MTRGLAVVLTVGLVAMAAFTTAGVSNVHRVAAVTPNQPNAVTPNQTTTAGTKGEAVDLPPGTSESGIENATRLLETHRSLLANATYSLRLADVQVSQVTNESGTFVGFDVGHVTLSADRGSNAIHVTLADENLTHDDGTSSQSYWVTGEVTALKQSNDDGLERTTYFDVPPTGMYSRLANRALVETYSEPSFVLRPYLVGLDYEYADTVTHDGRTLHRFTSTGLNETAVETHGISEFRPPVERVDATILVDERGVIHSFEASVTRSRENETVTTGTSYEVTDLGNVTPVAPDWVTEEIPHLDASLSANGSVVRINHTGGMTVTEAGVLFYTHSTEVSTEFTGTFEPGETLYLYLLRDADRVVLSETRPAVNESFVRFGGDNASITPWRMVTENRSFTTLEVIVHDASNRTTPPTTGTTNRTSLATTEVFNRATLPTTGGYAFESRRRGGSEGRPPARFREP